MKKTVFLGSTSVDLTDVRAELRQFIPSLGFRIVCFEDPNFKKEPRKHRHDMCLDNVGCCDIYVLIIDKWFGEKYQGINRKLRNKSVTWAEVEIALEKGKIICAFVRRLVWNEKATWAFNRSKGIKILPYYARDTRVFKFIEFIASRRKDNWFDQFDDSPDLKEKMSARLLPMKASV